MTVESTDLEAADGTRLRLWERIPDGDATEAVLFVHGATYGGRAAFAPDDHSWLAAVADAGRAAFALDVRGYGDSERPPELDAPADDDEPVVRATTAAEDVETALAHVRGTVDAVHLVGYSWGTIICGIALVDGDVTVTSLTQYAPIYAPPPAMRDRFDPGEQPAAYRTVTRAEARDRWASQRPDAVPDAAFEAFWRALADSGQRVDDGGILAPNGTLVDLAAAVDERPYDASAIDVPALVVRGSLDTASRRSDALALYDALGADDRTYTELAGGTHFLQFERPREALYDAVRRFQDRTDE